MFFIPGFIVALVTFPGVVVHELAHQLACRFARVVVVDVCYFQLKRPNGYVLHEPVTTVRKQLVVGLAPLVVNTLLGMLICMPATISVFVIGSPTAVDWLLMWLGVSIAMHAFPSRGDVRGMWQGCVRNPRAPFIGRALLVPVLAGLFVMSLGGLVWLDALYGLGAAYASLTVLQSVLGVA
jgi:hypothetical protein